MVSGSRIPGHILYSQHTELYSGPDSIRAFATKQTPLLIYNLATVGNLVTGRQSCVCGEQQNTAHREPVRECGATLLAGKGSNSHGGVFLPRIIICGLTPPNMLPDVGDGLIPGAAIPSPSSRPRRRQLGRLPLIAQMQLGVDVADLPLHRLGVP